MSHRMDVDPIERVRHQYGEYIMPDARRTPEQLAELRERNRAQDERLQRIEDRQETMQADIQGQWREIRAISTTLHGEHGDNGLRMSVRGLESKLDRLPAQIAAALAGAVTIIGTIVGIVVALVR